MGTRRCRARTVRREEGPILAEANDKVVNLESERMGRHAKVHNDQKVLLLSALLESKNCIAMAST